MAKLKYNNAHPKVLTTWDGKGKKRKATDHVLQKGNEYDLPVTDPGVKKLVARGVLVPVTESKKTAADDKKNNSKT